jgi:copper oxidase (laccase) domain-containing protein
VAVVHLGWRGLLADLVARTVEAMADLGDAPQRAELGPCIRPGCYEFAAPELDEMTVRFGLEVASTTTWGAPALDVPAAVRIALREAGVDELHDDAGCTACDRRWYSHRARAEPERFATVAWIPQR